ncbi:MAG: MarR family transcriptional regulator [Reyranella sp.]|nr:MarR family transcriptional regulator [Reyranella sp.]
MSRQLARDLSPDHVSGRQRQWSAELPDIDTSGMAILGRARWITLAVRPAIEAVFARHGLDSGEFDVLGTLLRSGPPYRLRPTELFRSLMVSSGGMTARLAKLESARLVSRVSDPDDARSLLVQLTNDGRRRAEAAFREDMQVEAELLAGITPAEREVLAKLLAKLAFSLAKDRSEPGSPLT